MNPSYNKYKVSICTYVSGNDQRSNIHRCGLSCSHSLGASIVFAVLFSF